MVASDELELGQRLWLRLENVEAIGEDVLDAPDELRECVGDGRYGDSILSSSCFAVVDLGKVKERILLILYLLVRSGSLAASQHDVGRHRCMCFRNGCVWLLEAAAECHDPAPAEICFAGTSRVFGTSCCCGARFVTARCSGQ